MPAVSISSHSSSASPSCGIPELPWKQRISWQLAVVLPAVGAEAQARSTAMPSLCPQPYAAPSSALPQEREWDGCQTPPAPLRLVLQ